ncbi:MerR family transcriptional regulator [Antarctobacter sp.]|uniref:MerR family transcriptional regulator n=1 Tax=Antarctobacter sp. TaxID=1872577 RepID=UPI002B27A4A2|nr:MerR family transcriptional regulator [Antarctobacter sp.]
MPKSRDAFRTISEVADWLETPAHVLRFWESKFSQVKPVKRAGGRRYYRPADMELLGGIKKLLHDDGMTIKGVQKVLREQGVRHVASLAAQSAEADQSDLIEDAPYAEVPLHDTDGEVVAFPSEAVASRADDTLAPQTIDEASEQDPPEEDHPELDAEVAKDEDPADTDLREVEQPQTPSAPDLPAPDLSAMPSVAEDFENIEDEDAEEAEETDAVIAEEVNHDASESPLNHSAESQPPEVAQSAATEDVPDIAKEDEDPVEETVTPVSQPDVATSTPTEEKADLSLDPDPTESPDTPELPFGLPDAAAIADDIPAAVAESEPESKARNPLDLPDFSVSDTPPPVAEPAVRPAVGPLGQIAKLSALSDAQKAALAAQLPALEALRDRLSAPLS